jgi:hydrogenase small subunit
VLVVEGSIPTGNQVNYCYLWPGLTAMQGVQNFARNAAFVLAAGSCSSFGGIPAALPNPTGVRPLSAIVGLNKVINLPGCPMQPDWLVGTVAYLLRYGTAPKLDALRRPVTFYPKIIHERCPYKEDKEGKRIGFGRCLEDYGCKGKKTVCDCAQRKWNGAAANTPGINFCMFAGTPCLGCTEPGFPDSMSPFHGESDESDESRTSSVSRAESTSAPADSVQATEPAGTSSTGQKSATYQQRQLEKRQQYEQRKKDLRRAFERSKLGLDK